jgi:cellobiose-specific phosphotransferase system component IIC
MQDLYDALISLVPPLMVGGIFWIIMRAILGADRKERDTYNKIEAEERAKLAKKVK